jgi:hypothetical protein
MTVSDVVSDLHQLIRPQLLRPQPTQRSTQFKVTTPRQNGFRRFKIYALLRHRGQVTSEEAKCSPDA